MSRQRGMVLLLSLVLSLLLALLAASALRDALIETRLTGAMRDGLQAFEEAEAVMQVGVGEILRSPPGQCRDCKPPSRPHDLQGQWRSSRDGYFKLQNLGTTTGAAHMPEGEQVTLYRITAVSQQLAARQVLEAVYAIPIAQPQAPQRILWRQRLRQD
ncbi:MULTISPECIES: hypothetical protein [unclassified Pseudomonas]|uniref:hypothetical protein n=1 Tax=unclassified Pseudomonas TaxID=196821 RepID=UPI00128F4C18|nr:hypothetical protein [Pseudomonas sp. MN1F]MQG94914.1 hypothetical protein [Pseudomonas sp. MN1F]